MTKLPANTVAFLKKTNRRAVRVGDDAWRIYEKAPRTDGLASFNGALIDSKTWFPRVLDDADILSKPETRPEEVQTDADRDFGDWMTPERFREILDTLEWSQRGAARILNYAEGTVRYWARGKVRIPQPVSDGLEAMMRNLPVRHEYVPPPIKVAVHPRRLSQGNMGESENG